MTQWRTFFNLRGWNPIIKWLSRRRWKPREHQRGGRCVGKGEVERQARFQKTPRDEGFGHRGIWGGGPRWYKIFKSFYAGAPESEGGMMANSKRKDTFRHQMISIPTQSRTKNALPKYPGTYPSALTPDDVKATFEHAYSCLVCNKTGSCRSDTGHPDCLDWYVFQPFSHCFDFWSHFSNIFCCHACSSLTSGALKGSPSELLDWRWQLLTFLQICLATVRYREDVPVHLGACI